MHLDHQKMVELLAEAAGIEEEKVEKQLSELIEEIKQAIEEGDAYEVDGFGIFSGIGNNIIFIPSEEISTEINYKYVGMEPIEMETPAESEPVAETNQAPSDEDIDLEDDPFSGLIEDFDQTDEANDEPKPDEEESIEEENQQAEETENEFIDDLIFGEESEEDPTPKEKVGPESWGIDSYKEDDSESMFSGLLGAEKYDDDEKDSVDNSSDEEEDVFGELGDEPQKEELSIQLDEDEKSSEEDTTDDDFDDPFKGIDEDSAIEEERGAQNDEDEEIVPVITNISSGTGEKEELKNRELKPKTRKPKTRESSPILLWILLAIVLLGGGIYGLGYFGVMDIPGIDSRTASNQTTPANTPPAAVENEENNNADAQNQGNETQGETLQENEQSSEASIISESEEQLTGQQVTENNVESLAPDQPVYGLTGVPVDEANNGYTIVLYSFSRESNADRQQRILTENGYRTLVYSLPHAQYGTIYRVSLGQFETLRDAALAAEDLDPSLTEDYSITKIQP